MNAKEFTAITIMASHIALTTIVIGFVRLGDVEGVYLSLKSWWIPVSLVLHILCIISLNIIADADSMSNRQKSILWVTERHKDLTIERLEMFCGRYALSVFPIEYFREYPESLNGVERMEIMESEMEEYAKLSIRYKKMTAHTNRVYFQQLRK